MLENEITFETFDLLNVGREFKFKEKKLIDGLRKISMHDRKFLKFIFYKHFYKYFFGASY